MAEKAQGLRSINWQVQNKQGDVQNGRGNGEAKELICTTNEYELRQGEVGGEDCWIKWGYWTERGKGGKIGTTIKHNQ